MSNFKKNFFYQTVWQVLTMILPLVTSPLLSRSLGPEGIGTYGYLQAIISYFALAANLGVYRYGIREIAVANGDSHRLSKVFWEIWTLHSLLSVAAGLIFFLYVAFFSEYKMYLFIMSLQYIGAVLDIEWLFAGLEDFKNITLRNAAIKLATFILIVFLVRDTDDFLLYVIIMSVSGLFSSLYFWKLYRKYVTRVQISVKSVFAHMRGFLVLFVPVLLESVYMVMDKIMLGLIDTKEAVGFYENAEKALIANRIIHALTNVMLPRMSFLIASNSKQKIQQLMQKSVELSLFLSSAFAFGTAGIAKEFSVIFWGKDFASCTELIMIMAMGMPVMAISRIIREAYLIPAGEEKKYMLSTGAGAVTNFIINLCLIPHIGVVAAAISTLAADVVLLLVQYMEVRKQILLSQYLRGNCWYVLFGGLMFVCVRLVGRQLGIHVYTLIIEIMTGMMVYLLLCLFYWKTTGQDYLWKMIKKGVQKAIGRRL